MLSLVAVSAFFIAVFGMPNLIKVAKLKRLVDDPEDPRKIHHRSVPTIGGVMIYFVILTNGFFWLSLGETPSRESFQQYSVLLTCMTVVFAMGLKDDLIGMSASKKLMVHLIAGALLVTVGGFRIEGFGGLFGVEEMPETISTIFSLFVYIVIVNAWNLIDGIDGLAGGYSAIAMAAFSAWFLLTGQIPAAILSLTILGATLGFLVFNFAPARIFLGDCGSLVLGVVGYALATNVIQTPGEAIPEVFSQLSRPTLAMAILAYPLVDTLRVFFLRAIRGISPFHPDQNHMHHRLMMKYKSHRKTAIFVYFYSFVFIGLAFSRPFLFPNLGEEGMFFGLLLLSFLWFLPILRQTRDAHHKNVKRQDTLMEKSETTSRSNKRRSPGKSALSGS
jgi:UDP-N-acetylmuramyl pentapeptide phosphotransferase/UDP-N-acetylglucosamine-1-phosphate transferase